MDTNNLRPTATEFGDWRAQLQRKRTVNKIMDTFKSHLPFTEYERLQELKKIAGRVEEEIYIVATSQSEYTRKMCFMMLAMETRLQNPIRSNSAVIHNSVNPSIPLDLTANGDYWQKEVFQKIKYLKDLYRHEYSGWRAQMNAHSREMIRNKIMTAVKRPLPLTGHEGLQESKKIAARIEEKIYAGATSKSEYLQRISLRMLAMESRSQYPMQSNFAPNSVNPSYPGSQVMQRVNNHTHMHVTSNNIQPPSMNNYIVSTSLSSALPPGSRLQLPTMASFAGQSSNLQNIPNMSSGQQNQLVGDTSMEPDDWRDQLQADSRERVKDKILETLKRHLPYSGDEGLQELNKIAVRFEEKIYDAAISQSDYLRKISLKMLTMENR